MKKITYLFLFISAFVFSQQQTVTYSISPPTFEENESITITFDGSSINESTWGVTDNALYLWAWSFDLNLDNIQDCPTNGSWDNSDEANRLTYNSSDDTYTITFVPSTFYNRTGIGRIGFLVKAKDGSGDKKTQDILVDVGSFQVILNSPAANSTTILNSGDDLAIQANNTGGSANYVLKANGTTINTQNGISSYSYTDTNITANQTYELEVTFAPPTLTNSFSAVVDPGITFQPMSADYEDGINYISDTEVILVLYATGKDFVYVAGSFNNWAPDTSHAMKVDPTRNNKFWIQLSGLTPGQIETYQYWVGDGDPVANSPNLVKIADPYSTLVLSPFDDPFIPASSYPNIPAYPAGQEREVTVLQTGQTPYDWQVDNFVKPKKEDLIVYEVLIRDFDANRNYQDLIDRMDYFTNLKINAIELMPVMEYEGNESWGYNTSFHMALDKYYGTPDKFKEFVDLCHQNGIAVILDLAINHAFGRNPMVRMWMDDPDNDGWGEPSSENPYFNQAPLHSYNVGSDFDHSHPRTKDYTKRVVKHWIEEYRIDGIRWDLTKGFTQNCSANDEGCTNAYQQDRVDVLKEYADYSWSLDEDHYVIFEHLGSENEEKEWANYRYDEGKGIMMWGKMTEPYNQLTMGYASSSNIDGMGHKSRSQFQGPRVLGYAESHDEERLMYKNVQFGNSNNSSHDVKDLNTALSRMSALGAISTMIPGPKMIWHFSSLGMENSIFTCSNGSVNEPGGSDGDCKLDTKPQPQWVNNWLADANRNQIYNDWTILHQLKIEEPVFEGDYNLTSGDLNPRLHVFDNSLPASSLKDVVIITNFDVTAKDVDPDFPNTGTWYDLMDLSGSTTINVTDVNATISVPAGQFRIFGNEAATLSVNDAELEDVQLYPNPSTTFFQINTQVQELEIYDISGKVIKSFKGSFDPSYTYDISTLSTGIYMVKFTNIDRTPFFKKIIVTNE